MENLGLIFCYLVMAAVTAASAYEAYDLLNIFWQGWRRQPPQPVTERAVIEQLVSRDTETVPPKYIMLSPGTIEAYREFMEKKETEKTLSCPFSCENYHRGRVGARACLAGHWDERDAHKLPRLIAKTLEPEIPPSCGAIKGKALLEDTMGKARRRGWR